MGANFTVMITHTHGRRPEDREDRLNGMLVQ